MKVTDEDKLTVQKFYQKNLKTFGPYSSKTLNWNDEFAQFTRFKILSDVDDLKGKSVLDFGCGLGDLHLYLSSVYSGIKYEGTDLVEEFISEAKRKYPRATFNSRNIYDYLENSFDYVFASGTFSYKLDNYYEKAYSHIEKIFSIAKEGVAFNMLDSSKHMSDGLYAAYEIEKVVTFCKKLTAEVKLKTGYLPNDFTIYMYKKR